MPTDQRTLLTATEELQECSPRLPHANSASQPEVELPVTTIRPRGGWQLIDVHELWRYRELLFFLAWRDIKVRYKQAMLGAAWAILQPLATMLVFSLFFSRLAKNAPEDLPYPLFVFSGLLPWIFFANAINAAGQSVVGNQNLVTKIYFPRLIIPMGAVGAGLVDFAIAFAMLLVLMLRYGVAPGWGMVLLPLMVLMLATAALGVGTLLSALTVAYRDFRYAVPFLMQLWMFATPSVYLQAETLLGPEWQALLPLNPAYGLIANFRASALGGPIDVYSLALSSSVSILLLVIGSFYFRRVERSFADII